MTKAGCDAYMEWFETQQCSGHTIQRTQAAVIRELPLDVFVDGKKIVSIACTGNHVKELAIGFLFSEGLIRTGEDVAGTEISENGRVIHLARARSCRTKDDVINGPGKERSIASSGARSSRMDYGLDPLKRGRSDSLTIAPAVACSLMDDMIARAILHEKTRGTHCAALADRSGVVTVREDIGRHNAVDMLAGYMLINHIDASEKMIVRTGRISAEIIHKIWNMGIPIVISISVPTSAAIHLAKEAGITVIGSVRGDKMVIYNDEERVRI
jgi:FdhD protein